MRKAVLATTIGLVAIAMAWWVFIVQPKGQRTVAEVADAADEVVDTEPPPPPPYEVEILPGLRRGDPDLVSVFVPSINKRLPVTRLHTMESEPGEDKITFLHRVRESLVEFSHAQNFEACAEICANGNQYGVAVTTIEAAAYCLVTNLCPEGYVTTQQSIHSHCPKLGYVRATRADEWLSQGTLKARKVFSRCDTEKFSTIDYAGRRPSWLAGVNALYRQDGPSSIVTYHPSDLLREAPGEPSASSGRGATH